MRDIVLAAKANLLCQLPVPIVRKKLKRIADEAHTQAHLTIERQLLVDVSTIIRNDARTGIQRVVRALLLQLFRRPPIGFRVRPVFATRKQGYRYAPENADLAFPESPELTGTSAVSVRPGDLFLGLDLAAHILPRHKGELAQWKRQGVEINVVVYDLLPVLHPTWFNSKNTRNIRRWLRTLAILADRLVCISKTVRTDLEDWLLRKYSLAPGTIPISVIPLGADIDASMPSRGLPENIDALMQVLSSKPTILMVGTLEPRKSHGAVLAAFNDLWKKGRDVNLAIVGKSGWKTESLQQILRAHPQHARGLHWLEDASDELLMLLYAQCSGVIVASHAEGFGLSFIEGLYYQKPVLARNIPVFREIGGDFATYFSGEESLAKEIETWLVNIENKQVPLGGPQHTWQNSAHELCNYLGLKQPIVPQSHQAHIHAQKPQEAIA
jgi:glycosyltransferase involved in cell wall biosynthesis